MASLLPFEFMCLRHVESVYARHVTLEAASLPITGGKLDDSTDAGDLFTRWSSADVGNSRGSNHIMPSPASASNISVALHHARTNALFDSPTTVDDESDNMAATTIPSGSGAPCAVPHSPPSCYFTLRHPETRATIFVSEVCHSTSHPMWRGLPSDLIAKYGALACVGLELYAAQHSYIGTGADASGVGSVPHALKSPVHASTSGSGHLLLSLSINMRRLHYLGASVAQADGAAPFPSHTAGGCTVLLQCRGGVFVPLGESGETTCYLNVPPPGPNEVGWSRSPGGVGVRAPARETSEKDGHLNADGTVLGQTSAASSSRLPGAPTRQQHGVGMTVGDVKALTTGALAWIHLRDMAVARCDEERDRLDHIIAGKKEQTRQNVGQAVLNVRLAMVKEQLTRRTQELENLSALVKQREHVVANQKLAIQLAEQRAGEREATVLTNQQRTAEQELHHASLRAMLARCRQRQVQEVSRFFRVEVVDGGDETPHRVHGKATRDTIRDCALPMFGNGWGSADAWAATACSTADALFEEARALGYAAHLVTTLATLFGVTLPHPVLLAGERSRLLRRPDVPPAAVATNYSGVNDVKLPLYCLRVADRPLMLEGIRLLLNNIVVLSGAMGKAERPSETSNRRLGVALHRLLST